MLGLHGAVGCYSGFRAHVGDDADAGEDVSASWSGTSGESGSSDDSGSGDDGPVSACGDDELELSSPSPLRRLTRDEYNNTIRDLLGDDSRPADAFLPDEKAGHFAANNLAGVSTSHVRAYIAAAEDVADTAVARDLDAWLGCDATSTACVESFLGDFARRAYRRPLGDGELDSLVAVFETGRTEQSATTGIRNAIAVALSSPNFLYLVELGEPIEPGSPIVRLSPYALASRLSYFVWSSMPDDELLDAAETGGLDTQAGIEEQARRMLTDDRAADTLASFHAQWLEVDHLADAAKDAEVFPMWGPELVASIHGELRNFVDHVVRRDDGRLETLLTASYSFIDDDLAALYGVPAPAAAFDRVELEPAERAGLLTQAAFLSAHAYPSVPSEIHRGKLVREQLLCQTLPPPPDDVDASLPSSQRLMDPACLGCHSLMDPIGYGFDAYDAVGALRTENANGDPVSTAGEIIGSGAADGPFDGARELAERLAGSPEVHDCFVDRWIEFATRSASAEDTDNCTAERARAVYAESEHDIEELMVVLTTTDAFRYRFLERD
jgi:hypothetical protein